MSPLSSSAGAYSTFAVSSHVPLSGMAGSSPRGVKRSRSPDVRYDQTGADAEEGTWRNLLPLPTANLTLQMNQNLESEGGLQSTWEIALRRTRFLPRLRIPRKLPSPPPL